MRLSTRIANTLRTLAAKALGFSALGSRFYGSPGGSVSMARNARGYAAEGYGQCVVAFRCVDIIAKAMASIPLVLRDKDGTKVTEHEALTLLTRPNAKQSWAALCQQFAGFYGITGNAFLQALGPDNRPPTELWVWDPFNMAVVTPRRGMVPVGYVYDDGNPEHRMLWEVDILDGSCDLLHWRTFNPLSPWHGMSAMEAAAYAVDQHNAASLWNKKLLDNNASPSGALVSEKNINEAQFARIKEELAESYQGAVNAKRPMLLEGGLKWTQYSLSPLDMDWLNGKNASAQDIAAAYGVPLQVIPLPGSQTFANYQEARAALWEDTVIPQHNGLCEMLTNWLLPKFGLEGYTLCGDFDKVPALEGGRIAKATAINAASYMNFNEKRAAMGLDPIDDPAADVLYVPAGMIPLGFDSGEPETEEEDPEEEDPEEEDPEEEDEPVKIPKLPAK